MRVLDKVMSTPEIMEQFKAISPNMPAVFKFSKKMRENTVEYRIGFIELVKKDPRANPLDVAFYELLLLEGDAPLQYQISIDELMQT